MPVAKPEPSEVRVIAHVDLDCFYVQVEQRKRPELRGKPTGVVQYNPWKGGGLIAVGYEARNFGVTRNMRGDEARRVCPDIELIQVPVAHGKADLTQYRDAGSEVVAVLSRKGTCERASIDEVYLDITEVSGALSLQEPFSEEVTKSHILGLSEVAEKQSGVVKQWLLESEADLKDYMLARGALVIADLRMAVLTETGFTCSAGIAHNKMLAKLASGMHKPAQQTLVPSSSVSVLLATLPIKKMKQLGGKLGDSLRDDLKLSFVGDLLQFPESKLQDLYGVNTGTWLWNTARGLSGDEVKARTLPKSHSCGKTFPGPKALSSLEDVKYWITELAMELQERLDIDLQQNHRMAHLLTVHAGTNHGYKANQDQKFPSKSCVLRYGKEKIASDAFRLFERGLNDYVAQYGLSPKKKGGASAWAITSLFIGASNIWATPVGMNPITRFFQSPATTSVQESAVPSSPSSPPSIWSSDAPLPQYKSLDMEVEDLNLDLDEPTSEVSLGASTKDAQENDVMCTPTFGHFGHVNTSACTLQLPTMGRSGAVEVDSVNAQPVMPEFDPEHHLSEAQSLVIDCSPVEQEQEALIASATVCNEDGYREPLKNSDILLTNATVDRVTDMVELGHLPDSIRKEPQLGFTASESRQQVSKVLKLKDMWDRKDSSSASSSLTGTAPKDYWIYKQEEIDEAVLSELPADIQAELCRSLGCKRPRVVKKSTIGDFFRNSLPHRVNREDS